MKARQNRNTEVCGVGRMDGPCVGSERREEPAPLNIVGLLSGVAIAILLVAIGYFMCSAIVGWVIDWLVG